MLGSPAEAAEGADVILTVLPDAEAVLQTMESARPTIGDNTIWLQASTLGERGIEQCMHFATP